MASIQQPIQWGGGTAYIRKEFIAHTTDTVQSDILNVFMVTEEERVRIVAPDLTLSHLLGSLKYITPSDDVIAYKCEGQFLVNESGTYISSVDF